MLGHFTIHVSSGLFISTTEKQKKSVAMATLVATLVATCFRKTNQLKSMQGFGMQRYPRKIFKPKKHKKVLPGGAEKLISSNLCSGMDLFICLFGVLRRFQHCTGHITTGSWKGRENQYI